MAGWLSPFRASDENLVQRAKEGDVRAFAELMERHQTRIHHLCLRFLGDVGLAEDVVQETFLAAWNALSTFRGDSAFGTWVHRIAVNRSRNRLLSDRRRHREMHLAIDGADDDDDPPLQLPDPTGGPDAVLLGRQVDDVIQGALDRLDEEQRVVLVLRDVQDLSYEEIADVLSVPRGTVKSRIHRARAALSAILGATLPAAERAS